MAAHGSRSEYVSGCRCGPCKAANAEARRRWVVRHKEALAALQALTDGELSEELAARGVCLPLRSPGTWPSGSPDHTASHENKSDYSPLRQMKGFHE